MDNNDVQPIIETKDLTIRFGGHVAVDHVNLRVESFTLKSIIGPNGAGKTTFFNLLSGQYKPTGGRVFFRGSDITHLGPAMRTRLGIGRSFQLTNIFPLLSVLENVRIAIQSRQRFGLNFWRNYLHFSETEDEAYAILKEVLLDGRWADPASALTHGEQRKLELAILMALKPKVLFLDEPTAGMSPEETAGTIDLIKKLSSDLGLTILFCEHDIALVFAISTKIMVMQQGETIIQGEPDEVRGNSIVQEAYLGGGV